MFKVFLSILVNSGQPLCFKCKRNYYFHCLFWTLILFIATNVTNAKPSLWERESTVMSVMILICVMAVTRKEASPQSKYPVPGTSAFFQPRCDFVVTVHIKTLLCWLLKWFFWIRHTSSHDVTKFPLVKCKSIEYPYLLVLVRKFKLKINEMQQPYR